MAAREFGGFRREKFKALVHYICWSCKDPKMLGRTKLNKALWFSDIWFFLRHGVSVTGARYIKRQLGPCPSALLPVLDELRREGMIAERVDPDFYGRDKYEYAALRKPDLTMFSGEEVSVIDEAVTFVCMDHTGRSISDETHDDIWKMAEIGEEIPIFTVLASRLGEVDEDDVAWASRALEDHDR